MGNDLSWAEYTMVTLAIAACTFAFITLWHTATSLGWLDKNG